MATIKNKMEDGQTVMDYEDDDCWEEDDDDDEEVDGYCELIGQVKCLFCEDVLSSVECLFDHCSKQHSFNISDVCLLWNMDSISYIKMINYIRLKSPSPSDFMNRKIGEIPLWNSDDFMKPFDVEDLLLQYDVESLTMEQKSSNKVDNIINGDISQEEITLTKYDYHQLLQKVHMAESRAASAESELQRGMEDMKKLRISAKELMFSQVSIPVDPPRLQELHEDEDVSYFDSYSHFDIHHQMLQDRVRTESYRDFMLDNKDYFKDKIVLDVGCGTGILSMFAVKAGASHVIGVDQSEIIYQAMDIIRENGFENKITLLKGRLEDVDLPYDKVDIIISEWMGYFLLFESMLDTVLVARDKYLKPGGMVFPDVCSISLSAIADQQLYDKDVQFWDDVYGFKMSCFKSEVIKEACINIIDDQNVVTEPYVVKTLDVSECQISDLQFKSPFSLTMKQDGEITGFIGYFNIYFQKHLTKKVKFSTGPEATPTHWKQTVFLLPKPLSLAKGEKIEGNISCRKNRKDPRSLLISITYNGIKHVYIME